MSDDNQPDQKVHPLLQARVYAWTLVLVLIFALYLAARVFFPFLDAIILAIIIAAVCYPLYQRLLRLLKGRTMLASLLFIVLFVLCLIIPISLFATALAREAMLAVVSFQTWAAEVNLTDTENGFMSRIYEYLGHLDELLPAIDLSRENIQSSIQNVAKEIGAMSLSMGRSMLGNTFNLVVNFFIMLLFLFYLLNDGPTQLRKVKYLLPMEERQVNIIISSLSAVARSILLGGIIVALVQGTIGGIGMALVGLPGLFWGSMMGVASFIPVVGTAVVWLPASIYLLATDHLAAGIFLLCWSGILVSGSDTLIRSFIMKGSSGLSTVLLLLSLLGGIKTFGAIGLLYGPLILMFAVAVIRIFREEFKSIFGRGKSQETIEQGAAEK